MVSLTVSPSSFTIKRKTPWVAGCCGPKFTTYSSVPNWDSPPTLTWLNNKSVIGKILSQRILFVILRHHDGAQIGMSFKNHTIEVEDFPLEPIVAFLDIFEFRRFGIGPGHIECNFE